MAHTGAPRFRGTERFEVVSRIGAGGMGAVYEAFDREQQQQIAIKTIRTRSADEIFRLKNEFRALQDLAHPNLVTLGELYEADGQWFFTMELVRGRDFISYIRTDNEPTLETRLRQALLQLADVVQLIHDRGRVHRDIKPTNLLVTHEGRLVLLDFGLVAPSDPDMWSTEHPLPVGTAAYMAPEQAASKPVGPAADWYAVGVLLYEALTGRPPFSGPTLKVMMAKQRETPRRPRELAPEVPEDLEQLCLDLLQLAPEARPRGPEIKRRLSDSPTLEHPSALSTRGPLFVGRTAELAALFAAFEQLKQQRPATVLVHGHSGQGKSELLRTFARQLTGRCPEAMILAGRCYERESVPFKAFDEVVDNLSRLLRRLPRELTLRLVPRNAELLSRVFPVLGRVPALQPTSRFQPAARDRQELRQLAFGALRELLAGLADARPLLICIDDLQWADADSLKLLRLLLRPPGPPAFCLLGALRTATAPRSSDGSNAGEAQPTQGLEQVAAAFPEEHQQLEVGPLPPTEARLLAEGLLRAALGDAIDELRLQTRAEQIEKESAGHPLYIHELARHAEHLGEQTDGEPLRLDDALWARISALELAPRQLVEVAAVAGEPVQLQVAAEATGIQLRDLSRQLSRLRAARLLRGRGHRLEDLLEPYHDRVREAVINRLERAAQTGWHKRLAGALLSAGIDEPDSLARHFEGAGEFDHAAHHAVRAAERAEQALAFDHAAELYGRTLRLLAADERPEVEKERRRLWIKQADALANAGRGVEASAAYQQALEGAGTVEALELKRKAAEQLMICGQIDAGLEIARQVLTDLGYGIPRSPTAKILSVVSRRLFLRVRGIGYRRREETEIAPDELLRVDAYATVGRGLFMVHSAVAMVFLARFTLAALRLGEPRRVCRALLLEAQAGAVVGLGHGSRQFRRLLRSAEALCEEFSDPLDQIHLELVGAWGGLNSAKFQKAMEHVQRAELLARAIPRSWEITILRIFRCRICFYLGELAELTRIVEPWIAEAQDQGNLLALSGLQMDLANIAVLARDDPARARQQVDEVMPRWSVEGYQMQHFGALVACSHIDLYQGDMEAAHRRLVHEWPQLCRSGLFWAPSICSMAHYFRGRIGLGMAHRDAAGRRAHLARVRKSIRRLRRLRRLPECQALARVLQAGLGWSQSDLEAARSSLAEAVERFDALEMKLHAAAARRRLGQLVGGEEGQALRAVGEAFMVEQEIKNPEAMTRALVPDFNDA